MKNKELITRIRSLITKLSEQKTRVELEGAVIEWSGELGIGTQLSAVEGEVPETVTLEDGRTLTIEDNKVSGITALEAETPVGEEAEAEEEEGVEAQASQEEEEIEVELQEDEEEEIEVELSGEELRTRLETLESNIASLVESFETMKTKLDSDEQRFSALNEKVTEIAKVPAAPATKKNEVSNSFNKTESRAAKVFASKI